MSPKLELPFFKRIRERREELGFTRDVLAERIEGRMLSASAIKMMEQMSEGKHYKLPQRIASRFKRPAIELLADALDVPIGYLLAGFSDAEIDESIYGAKVRAGKIRLMPELRQQQQRTSFKEFLRTLPTSESELLGLPLHAYANQFAFGVIFRIERLYSGLEMLFVNEPPLIFWDKEDIALWVENMKLDQEDAQTLHDEFLSYQMYFRNLAKKRSKTYKVVINYPTLKRFLDRKSAATKSAAILDMQEFMKLPNFSMVLFRPAGQSMSAKDNDEAREAEVLCKKAVIPDALDQTISVQIVQTPPHISPVAYLVSPTPKNFIMLQKEIGYINQSFANSLDQYRSDLGVTAGNFPAISDRALQKHTLDLLQSI